MATPKFAAGLQVNNKPITNLADPTNATDAATKQYVDNVAAGLKWKEAVRVASTANITIASALTNGSTIDGYTVVASGAAPRASDANTSAEVDSMVVRVEQGTVNGDKMYLLTTDNPTLDTTALVFTQFTGGGTAYVAGNGLTESPAGTFNVGAGTGISVNADDVQINTSLVVRKGAANCVATTNPQTFAHGAGSLDVVVQVMESGSVVYPDITIDATNITVDWGGAPTAAQYRVIWHY
jgi:hypothetical protein